MWRIVILLIVWFFFNAIFIIRLTILRIEVIERYLIFLKTILIISISVLIDRIFRWFLLSIVHAFVFTERSLVFVLIAWQDVFILVFSVGLEKAFIWFNFFQRRKVSFALNFTLYFVAHIFQRCWRIIVVVRRPFWFNISLKQVFSKERIFRKWFWFSNWRPILIKIWDLVDVSSCWVSRWGT